MVMINRAKLLIIHRGYLCSKKNAKSTKRSRQKNRTKQILSFWIATLPLGRHLPLAAQAFLDAITVVDNRHVCYY